MSLVESVDPCIANSPGRPTGGQENRASAVHPRFLGNTSPNSSDQQNWRRTSGALTRFGWKACPFCLRRLVIAVALTLAATISAEGRTWKDRSGQMLIEADMVGHAGDKVWLQQIDDDLRLVAIDDLDPQDQQFARQQIQKQGSHPSGDVPPGMRATAYLPGRTIATLADPAIDESSGLACSRRTPGVFWTHNDSGDAARLYAFDRKGRDLGSFLLRNVQAFDWEDMASWSLAGKNYLLIGDTGNNGRNAGVHMLYLVEEPEVDPVRGVQTREMPVTQVVHFSYEDEYRDCEALAVDPTSRTVLLVSKEKWMVCYAYALYWPENDPRKAFVARRIATLRLPLVTAMDVSPDGCRAVLLTYGDAYEFLRAKGEGWGQAFSRRPNPIALPGRRQGESICYGPDGKTLYLTSEKGPTPLIEILPVEKQ